MSHATSTWYAGLAGTLSLRQALGASPSCRVMSAASVRVWFGENATIATGAVMHPSSTLLHFGCGAPPCSTILLASSVSLTSAPPELEVAVVGPGSGLCGSVVYDASASAYGGRDMAVVWYLVLGAGDSSVRSMTLAELQVAAGVEFNNTAQSRNRYAYTIQGRGASLTLHNIGLLPTNAVTTVAVAVSTWLGQQSIAAVPLHTPPTGTPMLVVSRTAQQVLRAAGQQWTASWRLPGNGSACSLGEMRIVAMQYDWGGVSPRSRSLLRLHGIKTNSPTLVVPAWVLPVNESLTFSVRAWGQVVSGGQTRTVASSVNFTVLAASSPPVLRLSGTSSLCVFHFLVLSLLWSFSPLSSPFSD